MSDNNHSGESFIKGVIFGAIAGAIAGVLLAPAPGKETRRKLKQAGVELKDKAVEAVEDIEEVVTPWLEEAKENVQDAVEKLEDVSEPVREAAKEKLEDLEKQIARTKKRFFRGTK